jgi:hypothetical protein
MLAYNEYMSKEKAPSETPISNGAKLTSAEAERTLDTFIIALSVVEPQQEISRRDLPLMHNRM